MRQLLIMLGAVILATVCDAQFPSGQIIRDPSTGKYYNVVNGVAQRVQMPGQSPDYDPNLSGAANLARLSPRDKQTVRWIASYRQSPLDEEWLMTPEFKRLLLYVYAANPKFDPRQYDVEQQYQRELQRYEREHLGQQPLSLSQAPDSREVSPEVRQKFFNDLAEQEEWQAHQRKHDRQQQQLQQDIDNRMEGRPTAQQPDLSYLPAATPTPRPVR